MMMVMDIVLSVICILMSVAFVTLLERKILSYSQNRIGPNKVILMGLIQPVLDGIKLLFKEMIMMSKLNSNIFIMCPMLSMLIMIMLWMVIPLYSYTVNMCLTFMMLMVLIGLSVYTILMMGWASNSKFSMIGSVRSCSQSISYEISMSILIFSMIMAMSSFNMSMLLMYNMVTVWVLFPIITIWLLSCLAECNRAPFDLAEGESELVSGFNVEYGSSAFALIFVSEYGMVIYFSLLTSTLFMSVLSFSSFLLLMLFIRSSYPRIRYDKLMSLAWLKMLPASMFALSLSVLI